MPNALPLLGLLMTSALLVVGQLYVTIPLSAQIAGAFGTDPETAALAGSAFGFAYAAGFLLFGSLSDRLGRRRVLALGLAALAVATLLASLAPTLALFTAARVAQGLAAALFPPAALALVAETLSADQRATGVSLMSFAFLAAAPLAQLLGASPGLGFDGLMLGLAPFYLAAATGVVVLVPKPRSTAGSGAPDVKAPPGDDLFRDPGLLAAWFAATSVLFGFVAFYAGAQGMGASVDLALLRLIGLPPLLLTFLAAPMIRRLGASATARTGLLVLAGGLVLAVFVPPSMIPVAGALVSAGVALAVPGLISTVAARATDRTRGRALAVYSFALFLGASLATPFAAAVMPFGFLALWLVPAVLCTLAATVLRVVANRRRVLARLSLPLEAQGD